MNLEHIAKTAEENYDDKSSKTYFNNIQIGYGTKD